MRGHVVPLQLQLMCHQVNADLLEIYQPKHFHQSCYNQRKERREGWRGFSPSAGWFLLGPVWCCTQPGNKISTNFKKKEGYYNLKTNIERNKTGGDLSLRLS